MKKVSAIFLLLIFSFTLTGSFVVLKIQQFQVRREMVQQIKAGIPKEQLTRITITSKNEKDITWKESEEFMYKGTMYDVVHTEKIEGKTIYHCLTDTQETKLVDELNKETKKKKNTKNRTNPPVKIAKVLSKINPLPQKENLFCFSEKKETFFYYFNNYSPPKLEISSPPPKIV